VHVILNAYWEPLDFEPIEERMRELTAVDRYCTGSVESDCEWNSEQPVLGTTYRAAARSVVVLIAAAE